MDSEKIKLVFDYCNMILISSCMLSSSSGFIEPGNRDTEVV